MSEDSFSTNAGCCNKGQQQRNRGGRGERGRGKTCVFAVRRVFRLACGTGAEWWGYEKSGTWKHSQKFKMFWGELLVACPSSTTPTRTPRLPSLRCFPESFQAPGLQTLSSSPFIPLRGPTCMTGTREERGCRGVKRGRGRGMQVKLCRQQRTGSCWWLPAFYLEAFFFFLGWDDLARGAVSYINMPLQLPPLIWEDFPQDFRKQAAGISSHSDTEH